MSCIYLSMRKKSRQGLMGGLVFKDGFLEIDKEFFTCCHAIGQYEEDRQVFVCGLYRSLFHARHALNSIHAIHKRFKLKQKEIPENIQKSLAHISERKAFRGKLLSRVVREKQAFLFEEVSFAASWVYGIKVYLVKIGETDIFKLLREMQDKPSKSPSMIMIRGLRKLSNPNHLQDFMVLADFAYNSMVPFWVEIIKGNSQPAMNINNPNPRSFKTKMSSKTQKPLLEQLPMATHERLLSFCKEIDYKEYINEQAKT